jgi:hypothetical protein
MTVKLLSVLVWAVAAVAAEPKPSTVGSHVWDSAALARCSSPYQREVLADPQARSGQAVRFTGEAGFISMHDEVGIAPGRSRFTVRLRLERGGHFATDFEAGGRGFQSRAPIEFAELPADGSFTERVVELNLPGPLNVVSLRGGLPKELIVDRITVEPVADASPVEVASLRVSKLVLAPGEAAEAGILLANYSGRERSLRLRLVAETGGNTEEILLERDVALPAATALQPVTFKLPVLPEGGYQLRADANVAAFRRNFVTVTEIDFWAPCDMSQLVPPPGKDRWWSGQTAQRFSTEQLRTCIAKAHAQGIGVLGYADYSVIFGFRGYDFGRPFPDCLDWRTQNDNGFVWLGFDAKNMGLDSDLRAEDDTRQDVKVTGVSRSLHTNPNAFRWHADQMVTSMKHFGWDGFRYDDPIDISPKHAFPYAFNNGADFLLAGMFDWQIAEDVAVAKAAFADAYTKRDRSWAE